MELRKIDKSLYSSCADFRKQMKEDGSKFAGCFLLENYEDMEKWDLYCKLFESDDTVPPGYSVSFQYAYVDNDEVVGLIDLRTKAMEFPFLRDFGGHIGYSVKPSRRKQGIGTNMLKELLMLCKDEYKLDKVLISCNVDNEGSRKIITKNGGVLEKVVFCPAENGDIERYWIDLSK